MKQVRITMSLAAAKAFLKMSERVSQDFSSAGCNDMYLPNNEENRDFYELVQMEDLELDNFEQLRDHEEYDKPKTRGSIPFVDTSVLRHLTEKFEAAVERAESS